jgi:hypothetical protein
MRNDRFISQLDVEIDLNLNEDERAAGLMTCGRVTAVYDDGSEEELKEFEYPTNPLDSCGLQLFRSEDEIERFILKQRPDIFKNVAFEFHYSNEDEDDESCLDSD